jgi:MSHA pilin protein MshD
LGFPSRPFIVNAALCYHFVLADKPLMRSSRHSSLRRRLRRRGLTLVEALLAAIVLVVVAGSVSQALLAGQMQAYDAAHRERGLELAEALMEEILRLPYADADGDGETGRANFDDLDDYNGYTDSGALTDFAGTAYPSAYHDFSRAVTVIAGSQDVSEFGAAIDGLNVTVTVTDAGGQTWTLQQFVPEPVE